ncbi:hypothetical protein Hdeb2414_s0001g00021811 [Helianthus debilis subsp. tardiflorus]
MCMGEGACWKLCALFFWGGGGGGGLVCMILWVFFYSRPIGSRWGFWLCS